MVQSGKESSDIPFLRPGIGSRVHPSVLSSLNVDGGPAISRKWATLAMSVECETFSWPLTDSILAENGQRSH